MFFGVDEPARMIREKAEALLREQVADAELERIAVTDEPKYLTMGAKSDDGRTVTVTSWAACLRTTLEVASGGGSRREVLDAALTFMFGDIATEHPRVETFFDVGPDAEARFDDDAFKVRFLRFRAGDE